MPKWSWQQDSVLWEHGHEGAERCATIIWQRFGISRTPGAVQRRASRIGASMLRYEICPGCGRRTREITERGVCPICHQRELAHGQREFNKLLQAEIRRSLKSTDEYRKAEREHEKARQENSRLCRKHGLPGKREREGHSYGENVDLSE